MNERSFSSATSVMVAVGFVAIVSAALLAVCGSHGSGEGLHPLVFLVPLAAAGLAGAWLNRDLGLRAKAMGAVIDGHVRARQQLVAITGAFAEGSHAPDAASEELLDRAERAVVDQLRARLVAAQAEALANRRILRALDVASTNAMIADSAGNILYMNDAVTAMLTEAEADSLTQVPLTPRWIRGVINLRGAVVPVIDLHARFGDAVASVSKRSCIVIIEILHLGDRQDIGILVDAVSAVVEIADDEIQPAPAFGASVRTEFIQGMGRVDGRFVIILDIDRTFSIDEMAILSGVSGG
jgi:purine-binding chemotaxis protein CheW